MTIQIAQRIGRALGVTSATKTKELDEALRAYVRSVGPGATVPLSGSIDWSHITSIPATFPPTAHTHPNGDLTGYTAADVLAKLLTVDGAGSGLDADLLDGQSSAAFAAAVHLTTNTWTPADASGAGLVLTLSGADYVVHENLAIVRACIVYPVTASGANALVSGLPFAVLAGDNNRQGLLTFSNTVNAAFVMPVGGGSSNFEFYTAAGAKCTNVQLSGATFVLSFIYKK